MAENVTGQVKGPFDVRAWLEGCRVGRSIPRHRQLSFMLVANEGNWEVFDWGRISHNGLHQVGLNEEDAIGFITMYAFMRGLRAAGVDAFEIFFPYLEAYIAEVRKKAKVNWGTGQTVEIYIEKNPESDSGFVGGCI
jgi:hypothetical protein